MPGMARLTRWVLPVLVALVPVLVTARETLDEAGQSPVPVSHPDSGRPERPRL